MSSSVFIVESIVLCLVFTAIIVPRVRKDPLGYLMDCGWL